MHFFTRIQYILICIFLSLGSLSVQAEKVTGASGIVVDAETGELLPFVQVFFVQSNAANAKPTAIGTTTDMEGQYTISNTQGYTVVQFKMLGYRTHTMSLHLGQVKKDTKIQLQPDAYSLEDVIVKPKAKKERYRRKNNPAVELIRNVIAHKDSATIKTQSYYTAGTYTRMSFALDNFTPDFKKGFWKKVDFIKQYIDTTGDYPSITLSIRENLANEYFQKHPQREKKIIARKRFFGLESMISTQTLDKTLSSVFTDVDLNHNTINLLFNRFVSPINNSIAVSYYQYYIMDTVIIDGKECIDLGFVPVNSESFGFTGHLYILNDSTYKIKKYTLQVPQDINLNFVSDVVIEHEYKQLDNGLWAPDRTSTYSKFYLTNRKRTLLARQTKIYRDFDFETVINPKVYSPLIPTDTIKPPDSTSIRKDFEYWDTHRPEPLSFYESSVMDLINDFKRKPEFNALIMAVDALTTEYLATVPSTRWGESKWDFGPIYNTVSWNMLEGVRLRIGGTTTANLHPHLFLSGYAAFGIGDLRPKGNLMLMYSFNKKRYYQYEPLRHYISVSAQYDVDEPGQQFGIVDRDNILMSIPTSQPVMRNMQYVLRTRVNYMKEWPNRMTLKAYMDYERNEAAGAMSYRRITGYQDDKPIADQILPYYNSYELGVEFRYAPGSDFPINRSGVETPFTIEQDAPVISATHRIGFLDDRFCGGKGFLYNYSEIVAEKRFWFSSFGHLDARIQAGIQWNQTPFTKLYIPMVSTSIFLGKNAFNLMQPMEFLFDKYVSLFATYYFKGWILNRIPGINRLKLRGVVSFSGIYGGLADKNNPFVAGNEGLYQFPDAAEYDINGEYIEGYTTSPIGALPYLEMSVGLENILKFIRVDYVRRLTYNEYQLPSGHTRKINGWGRNGVKVTIRFAL